MGEALFTYSKDSSTEYECWFSIQAKEEHTWDLFRFSTATTEGGRKVIRKAMDNKSPADAGISIFGVEPTHKDLKFSEDYFELKYLTQPWSGMTKTESELIPTPQTRSSLTCRRP